MPDGGGGRGADRSPEGGRGAGGGGGAGAAHTRNSLAVSAGKSVALAVPTNNFRRCSTEAKGCSSIAVMAALCSAGVMALRAGRRWQAPQSLWGYARLSVALTSSTSSSSVP